MRAVTSTAMPDAPRVLAVGLLLSLMLDICVAPAAAQDRQIQLGMARGDLQRHCELQPLEWIEHSYACRVSTPGLAALYPNVLRVAFDSNNKLSEVETELAVYEFSDLQATGNLDILRVPIVQQAIAQLTNVHGAPDLEPDERALAAFRDDMAKMGCAVSHEPADRDGACHLDALKEPDLIWSWNEGRVRMSVRCGSSFITSPRFLA